MSAAAVAILAALSPVERLGAMREAPHPALGSWTVWAPMIAALVVGTLLIVVHRRWGAQRTMLRAFLATAERLGLKPEERSLLARIARAAQMRNFGHIYTSEELFERARERFLQGREAGSMAPPARQRLAKALDALRAKLGFFGPVPEGGAGAAAAGAPLSEGDEVAIVRRGDPRAVQATVARLEGREVTLRSAGPLPGRTGTPCVIRRTREGLQWELDAAVVTADEREVVVRLVGETRRINMRRFARVPTSKPAYVANYPLVKKGKSEDLPRFVRGTLKEIGGPGLRIDAPLQAGDGEGVLAVLKLGDGKVVQGAGKVRRVSRGEGGVPAIVVEMVGLSEAEVGVLVQETNAVARLAQNGAGPRPAASKSA